MVSGQPPPLNYATKFRHILHTFRFYHLGSQPVTLMNSERPADFKNSVQYLSLIHHGAETCQNSRKGSMVFLDISKICLNFMA